MFPEKVSMGGKQGVTISDEAHDIIYGPEVGVSATRRGAFLDPAYEDTPQGYGNLLPSIY